MHELVRVGGGAGAVVQLIDRDQIAGLAVHHDLRDAARGAGHNRQTARHGLQVHDAQRLVDRRADERVAAVLKRVELRLGEHLLDPDDVAALLVQLGEGGLDLLHDLRGVRGARCQHDLHVLVHEVQRLQQIRQALLAGDAADEQQGRLAAVDMVAVEHAPGRIVVGRGGEVVHRDAVVDHVHLVRIDVRVGGQDVLLHAAGDCDDAVGVLIGVPLGPGAQVVAAAELLALPRAERLQAVRGDDQRDLVQLLGQTAGQAGVPGVGVDDVGVDVVGDLQIHAERLDRAVRVLEFGRGVIADDLEAALGVVAGDGRHVGLGTRAVEGAHGHVDALGQHLAQLLGMHAGTAVDLGRILAGQDVNLHRITSLWDGFHVVFIIPRRTGILGSAGAT